MPTSLVFWVLAALSAVTAQTEDLVSFPVSVLAGNESNYGTLDGEGSDAQFSDTLRGMVALSSGTVFVAEQDRIRSITPFGVVTTLAVYPGTLTGITAAGDALFCTDESVVYAVSLDGNLTMRAGSFNSGQADGQGTSAQFTYIQGITAGSGPGSASSLFLMSGLDLNVISGQIPVILRSITLASFITNTVAGGSGDTDIDGSGRDEDGTGRGASFKGMGPYGLTASLSGTVYLIGENSIRTVGSSSGVVTTVAGGNLDGALLDGIGSNAAFDGPTALAFSPRSGTLYVADTGNDAIRAVNTATFAVSTLTSGGMTKFCTAPRSIAVSSDGSVFVFASGVIRVLSVAHAAPCPVGSYCPIGTRTLSPCPPGTFGSSTGLSSPTCSGSCAAGYYGSSPGAVTATCSARCPSCHFCPPGASKPLPCPIMTVSVEGSSSCTPLLPNLTQLLTTTRAAASFRTSAATLSPLQLVAPAAVEFSYVSTAPLAVITTACCIGAAALLLWVFTQRCKQAPMAALVQASLTRVDKYPDEPRVTLPRDLSSASVDVDLPLVHSRSALGGLCSLLGVLTIASLAAILIIRYQTANVFVQSSLNLFSPSVASTISALPWAAASGGTVLPGLTGFRVNVFSQDGFSCTTPEAVESTEAWVPITAPSLGAVSALSWVCSTCVFSPVSTLSFTLPTACQALFIEVVAVDAGKSVSVLSYDPALSAASEAGYVSTLTWEIRPVVSVQNDIAGGNSFRGYQVVQGPLATTRVPPSSPPPLTVNITLRLPLDGLYVLTT